ncbi:MAG: hypothetical protein ACI92W_001970 [Paraglaciecola sp.]|jgi:hypothetical protein
MVGVSTVPLQKKSPAVRSSYCYVNLSSLMPYDDFVGDQVFAVLLPVIESQ